jgi:hypothetical protein
MKHTLGGQTWDGNGPNERDEAEKRALALPNRQLLPGDLIKIAEINASGDIGELGVVLGVNEKRDGAVVMINSKRSGFSIGWSFIWPWLEKA